MLQVLQAVLTKGEGVTTCSWKTWMDGGPYLHAARGKDPTEALSTPGNRTDTPLGGFHPGRGNLSVPTAHRPPPTPWEAFAFRNRTDALGPLDRLRVFSVNAVQNRKSHGFRL